MIDIKNCEVKIKINEKGNMLAQAEVHFSELHVYGYRIMSLEDSEKVFISPPATRSGRGKYFDLVRIEDPHKWELLSTLIKEKYKEAKIDFDHETKDINDDSIDPDSIPF